MTQGEQQYVLRWWQQVDLLAMFYTAHTNMMCVPWKLPYRTCLCTAASAATGCFVLQLMYWKLDLCEHWHAALLTHSLPPCR